MRQGEAFHDQECVALIGNLIADINDIYKDVNLTFSSLLLITMMLKNLSLSIQLSLSLISFRRRRKPKS